MSIYHNYEHPILLSDTFNLSFMSFATSFIPTDTLTNGLLEQWFDLQEVADSQVSATVLRFKTTVYRHETMRYWRQM